MAAGSVSRALTVRTREPAPALPGLSNTSTCFALNPPWSMLNRVYVARQSSRAPHRAGSRHRGLERTRSQSATCRAAYDGGTEIAHMVHGQCTQSLLCPIHGRDGTRLDPDRLQSVENGTRARRPCTGPTDARGHGKSRRPIRLSRASRRDIVHQPRSSSRRGDQPSPRIDFQRSCACRMRYPSRLSAGRFSAQMFGGKRS